MGKLAGKDDSVLADLNRVLRPGATFIFCSPSDYFLDFLSISRFLRRLGLKSLAEAYARFFHEYDNSPLLIVNAASIDPVNNQSDYDELYGAIQRMRKGRLYYNPMRHGAL